MESAGNDLLWGLYLGILGIRLAMQAPEIAVAMPNCLCELLTLSALDVSLVLYVVRWYFILVWATYSLWLTLCFLMANVNTLGRLIWVKSFGTSCGWLRWAYQGRLQRATWEYQSATSVGTMTSFVSQDEMRPCIFKLLIGIHVLLLGRMSCNSRAHHQDFVSWNSNL
jgi:hypothetical protein